MMRCIKDTYCIRVQLNSDGHKNQKKIILYGDDDDNDTFALHYSFTCALLYFYLLSTYLAW